MLPFEKPSNHWYVDPSRNISSADGTLARPFRSIAAALAFIETRIANGSIIIGINDDLVDNPQFIVLRSGTTENVNLTRGNVIICGETPNAEHVPIWIHGTVTITPSDDSASALTINKFGLFNVSIMPPSNVGHCIEFTGTTAATLYLQGVYAYQPDGNYSCLYADNNGGSRIDMINCTMARAGTDTYLIDIQRGTCNVDNLETNGTGQVFNFANNSIGTVLRSVLDSDSGAVITLGGTVQFGMGEVILNNTAVANACGVLLNGTSSMQFGVCTFNVPVSATNRAIKGTGTPANTVLYASPIFQHLSSTVSQGVTLTALATDFTAPEAFSVLLFNIETYSSYAC